MKTWGATIERYFLECLSDGRNMRACVRCIVFLLCVYVCFGRRPCEPALVLQSICLSNWLFCDSMHARRDVLMCKQQVYAWVCIRVCVCVQETAWEAERQSEQQRKQPAVSQDAKGLEGGERHEIILWAPQGGYLNTAWAFRLVPGRGREREVERERERGGEIRVGPQSASHRVCLLQHNTSLLGDVVTWWSFSAIRGR